MTYYINLSGKRGKGKRTFVDKETYELYGHLSWYLSDTGYVVRKPDTGIVRLHRLVANAPERKVVDHLNGNKLDNRAENLRVCSQSDNMRNLKNVKGYTWDASKKSYMVRYRGKFYGRYSTEEEAKKAYQLASSGVPYQKKRRKLWHLPTGISKQFGKYRVRTQVGGKRIWLGQFATLDEAKQALKNWQER
jgi:hypothetical protein